MNNQYAVLISSEIPELGELDLLRSIYRELNGYMEDYNNQINLDDLGDWKLLIQINLRNTNGGIGIFKRAKRFPSNKEFEISISIPVPNLEEARWQLYPKNSSKPIVEGTEEDPGYPNPHLPKIPVVYPADFISLPRV